MEDYGRHTSPFLHRQKMETKHLAQNFALLKIYKSFLKKKGKVLLTRVKIFTNQTRYSNLILLLNLVHFFPDAYFLVQQFLFAGRVTS